LRTRELWLFGFFSTGAETVGEALNLEAALHFFTVGCAV
jgi:hypothetical protein